MAVDQRRRRSVGDLAAPVADHHAAPPDTTHPNADQTDLSPGHTAAIWASNPTDRANPDPAAGRRTSGYGVAASTAHRARRTAGLGIRRHHSSLGRRDGVPGRGDSASVDSDRGRPTGSNRFDKEVAAIRKALELSAITVIERTCVEPSEVTRHLSAHRPTVLHLSAHNAYGAIGLAVDGHTHWVNQNRIGIAFAQGPAPRLTVLNICASQMLANALIGWCPAVLYWPGAVTTTRHGCSLSRCTDPSQ